jgi:hypothetical protein
LVELIAGEVATGDGRLAQAESFLVALLGNGGGLVVADVLMTGCRNGDRTRGDSAQPR